MLYAYIFTILEGFRPAFSRRATFAWFVAIVCGMLIRTDKLGLTSVVRDLSLRPSSYLSLLHFFRADAWNLDTVRRFWYRAICKHIPMMQENGMLLLAADGVKQSKEARRMPAVKRLHQESETQTKPETIFGHMWGCVGVLAGTIGNLFCIPASLRIHDGMQEAAPWEGSGVSLESHVVQTIRNACEIIREQGRDSIAMMDRYFLSVPALAALNEENEKNEHRLHLITKAKKSCVAYEKPEPRKKGQKGRPRRKGKSIKLSSLFETAKDSFVSVVVEMYGEMREVSYLSVDLLWGQKLYHPLRFVLVQSGSMRSILVSTHLGLSPETIIRLYSYRFRIEHTFREMKQQIGGFAYRFWSKSMEKLSHFRKKTEPSPIAGITDESARHHILQTFRAIEMYALVASIAMGILQAVSIKFYDGLKGHLRWQRTPSRNRVSEANVMHCLRRGFYAVLANTRESSILQFIRQHQSETTSYTDLVFA